MKALFILGTRPEVIKIKMVKELWREKGYDYNVCYTGQQFLSPDSYVMLDENIIESTLIDLSGEYDEHIMKSPCSTIKMSAIMNRIEGSCDIDSYDVIIVQGDTLSAYCGAMIGFLHQVPVAHIEAGLRTKDIYNPFPEEGFRRLISRLATYHFCPTDKAVKNLAKEGIKSNVINTGNTSIDLIRRTIKVFSERKIERPFVLVTSHRRESWKHGITNICKAVRKLAESHPTIDFKYILHANPVVREKVFRAMKHKPDNIILSEPLRYNEMVQDLRDCYFIMTDSGGLTEEASCLGKTSVILRKKTERTEIIENGMGFLAGTTPKKITETVEKVIKNNASNSRKINLFGDGDAYIKIVNFLEEHLCQNI